MFVNFSPRDIPEQIAFESLFSFQVDSENPNTRTILIRRNFIEDDVMRAFADKTILDHKVVIDVTGEVAVDDGGVFRDVLTQFWENFFAKYAEGETQTVPLILPQCDTNFFTTVGRILFIGFKQLGYFPVKMSLVMVLDALFGKPVLDQYELQDIFMKLVGEEESKTLQHAMTSTQWESELKDDIIDIISRYGVTALPSSANIKALIVRCAEVSMLERPMFAVEHLDFSSLKAFESFQSAEAVRQLYQSLRPTGRKVSRLIKATPTTISEQRVLDFLLRAVKTINEDLLLKFLRFVTGCDCISSDISIQFVKVIGLGRRLVAHTCSNVLDLPVSHTSYNEFLFEFKQQINANEWAMDFV